MPSLHLDKGLTRNVINVMYTQEVMSHSFVTYNNVSLRMNKNLLSSVEFAMIKSEQ